MILRKPQPRREIAAVTSSGDLVAILKPKDGKLTPAKCFVQP